jgi:aquaporin TIP
MGLASYIYHAGTVDDLLDKEVYRGAIAEFMNLFIFCFVSGASVIAVIGPTCSGCVGLDHSGLVCIALAHGMTITVLIYATGNISGGHINPAVTIGLFTGGVISITRGFIYVAVQCIGAICGSLFLTAIIPSDYRFTLGATTTSPEMNGGETFGMELFCTFFLMLVVFLTAVDEQGAGQMAPLAIGMTVVVDHFVAVPWTGASMNPARSFGPAVVAIKWTDHWIYWIGPMVGAVFASFVYSVFFLRRGITEKVQDEGKPQYDQHTQGVETIKRANTATGIQRTRRPTTFVGGSD